MQSGAMIGNNRQFRVKKPLLFGTKKHIHYCSQPFTHTHTHARTHIQTHTQSIYFFNLSSKNPSRESVFHFSIPRVSTTFLFWSSRCISGSAPRTYLTSRPGNWSGLSLFTKAEMKDFDDLKAPPIVCSRRQFKILLLFQK